MFKWSNIQAGTIWYINEHDDVVFACDIPFYLLSLAIVIVVVLKRYLFVVLLSEANEKFATVKIFKKHITYAHR